MNADPYEIEEDIANIIKAIAYFDVLIENEKIKAAENPNFDVIIAWNSLNLKQQECIDTESLTGFLATNRIAVSEKESEYLARLISSKEGINYQRFVEFILPRTNEQLCQMSLSRRPNNYPIAGSDNKSGGIYKKHALFRWDRVIQQTSEELTANILAMEVNAFREIEDLRKDFSNYVGQNVQQIFRIVDSQEKGVIDYEVLSHFFKKQGVSFNQHEFQGFIFRTTEDGDNKLNYEELIYTLLPLNPYTYPQYRQQFNAYENNEYTIRKAQEFKIDVSKKSFRYPAENTATPQRIPKMSANFFQSGEQKHDQFYQPTRKFFNPQANGQLTFHCDEGYMGQLKSYHDKYYQPSKENNMHYTNQMTAGIRYHDQHFDTFYKHLHERNQNEKLFNKYGKRYAYDSNMNAMHEEIISRQSMKRFPQSTTSLVSLSRVPAAERNAWYDNTVKIELGSSSKDKQDKDPNISSTLRIKPNPIEDKKENKYNQTNYGRTQAVNDFDSNFDD